MKQTLTTQIVPAGSSAPAGLNAPDRETETRCDLAGSHAPHEGTPPTTTLGPATPAVDADDHRVPDVIATKPARQPCRLPWAQSRKTSTPAGWLHHGEGTRRWPAASLRSYVFGDALALPKLPLAGFHVVDQSVALVAKLRQIKFQQLPTRLGREFREDRQPDAGIFIDEDELTVPLR